MGGRKNTKEWLLVLGNKKNREVTVEEEVNT